MPEIAYGKYEQTTNDFNREHDFASFHFNTNIYLFDLAEDCDCPVWSKEGNFIQKGFFIQLSPGVTRMTNSLGSDLQNSDEKEIYPELGVGAGIDFGVSDFFTITPMVKFFFSPNAKWDNIGLPGGIGAINLEGTNRQFFAGIRLGFRFDEISRY